MLLQADTSALLLVDMQTRLLPAIQDGDAAAELRMANPSEPLEMNLQCAHYAIVVS